MNFEYPSLATRAIAELVESQSHSIERAIDIIATAMIDDGVLHVFGTGHARLPMHEMAGRAGGLRPINLIRMQDLSVYGGAEFADVQDPLLERDPKFARPLYEISHINTKSDVLLMASNSGINGVTVEFAKIARQQNVPLIVVTSMKHTINVESRHPSGQRLFELADVVIDNLAPAGDAALPLTSDTSVGALSNLIGIVIVQMITEGVARRFLEAGAVPPVYRSMNLPGGDVHNATIEGLHNDRIHVIEP